MNKQQLKQSRAVIQSFLKSADDSFNRIVENLTLAEEDKDWIFEYLYNDLDDDGYTKMVEENVDRILTGVDTGV